MNKKTVVVVGAGKGNGNHIAREFASHDFRAALRGLAFAMSQDLKEKGVYVGVVIIMGNVAVGTHYDPALIAKEYWKLYTDRNEVEFIFK